MSMLNQKLKFLNKLSSPSTSKKLDHQQLHASMCPIAQASIGQHIRHSMGHVERAVLTVDDPKLIPRIYYDIRERGCLYETDMNLENLLLMLLMCLRFYIEM